MDVTKEQLQRARKNWEMAREKVNLQRDALGGYLKRQRKLIDAWETRLDKSEVKITSKNYQETKHMPENTATFDTAPLVAAMKVLDDRRLEFAELEKLFSFQQDPS